MKKRERWKGRDESVADRRKVKERRRSESMGRQEKKQGDRKALEEGMRKRRGGKGKTGHNSNKGMRL